MVEMLEWPEVAQLWQLISEHKDECEDHDTLTFWQRWEQYVTRQLIRRSTLDWFPGDSKYWPLVLEVLRVKSVPRYRYTVRLQPGFIGLWYETFVPGLWVYASARDGINPAPVWICYQPLDSPWMSRPEATVNIDTLIRFRDAGGPTLPHQGIQLSIGDSDFWIDAGVIVEVESIELTPVCRVIPALNRTTLIQILDDTGAWIDQAIPANLPHGRWFRVPGDPSRYEYCFMMSL
ncbi:hypothetical protein HGA91_00045 [candidate division WWE3 bacterium]|nr:hypothetical protein [candidate division WWE3 bacterium]